MIRLYLAEDQEMLQTALISILNLEDDMEVIGSATSGDIAFQEIQRIQPDIVVLDIEMPGLTGLDVCKGLRDKSFAGKIIILTTFERQDYFEKAVELEVDGFLLKDNPTSKLIGSIHEIMDGNTIYSPELVRNVLRAEKNPLTERELEILKLIAKGLKTSEISSQLFLSVGTVRNYISSILSKTGAQSRIEAVNIAQKHQWLY